MSENRDSSENFKATLHLPVTDFPMRAGLPTQEPKQIEKWLADKTYYRMVAKPRSKKFLLHDGPPYANGSIHIGHALNKVLKDVVIKYKNLAGYSAAYVPGWDCHGLPIELAVEAELAKEKKSKSDLSVSEIRARCRAYADRFIDIQREQFKRLSIFGEWDHPYKTMDSEYAASIVRELGRCAKNGFVYRGNKVVSWCPSCQTALADAEIEYAQKRSPSITVKFELDTDARAALSKAVPGLASELKTSQAVFALIWTTTPWTLPANRGIALHPDFDYTATQVDTVEGKEIWITATELVDATMTLAGVSHAKRLGAFRGSAIEKTHAKHPFIADQKSLFVLGKHVTKESGTGLVHTAPGHGVDDYRTGLQYGLEIFSPVDGGGKYTDEYAEMKGVFVFKANAPIIEKLKSSKHLVAHTDIEHAYQHCWRCQNPIIFRATPQWFIAVDPDGTDQRSLRKEATQAIHATEWVPSWGINRILGMIESRPDWCISRQRTWGVPLTVFYCADCDREIAKPEIFEHVAGLIAKKGPEIWYEASAKELFPGNFKCDGCGSGELRKEKDILDVWFDSGVSHAAVCEARGLGWPADLYLEGSDQHRGWFQTSLLAAVAARGKPPFKAVLTHGFINDQHGKKMSKSKGNVTSPLDIVRDFGADILRLWVVLEDYRKDISFSKESLDRVSESYRKIRNTIRFLLGNLFDFDPAKDAVPLTNVREFDRWALARTAQVLGKMFGSYDAYEFHGVYHELVNFCSVDLSARYFDILKDRLYTAGKNSIERRSSQTAMWLLGSALLRTIAPILSYTTEEAWGYLPKKSGLSFDMKDSIFLSEFPQADVTAWLNDGLVEKYDTLWVLRDHAMKALEEARTAKTIGHPREAALTVHASAELWRQFDSTGEDAARFFLVSQVSRKTAVGDPKVDVGRATGTKCPRCWTFSESIGKSKGTTHEYDEVCDRCAEALT